MSTFRCFVILSHDGHGESPDVECARPDFASITDEINRVAESQPWKYLHVFDQDGREIATIPSRHDDDLEPGEWQAAVRKALDRLTAHRSVADVSADGPDGSGTC